MQAQAVKLLEISFPQERYVFSLVNSVTANINRQIHTVESKIANEMSLVYRMNVPKQFAMSI